MLGRLLCPLVLLHSQELLLHADIERSKSGVFMQVIVEARFFKADLFLQLEVSSAYGAQLEETGCPSAFVLKCTLYE